jgi:transcription elongation factor SPT5
MISHQYHIAHWLSAPLLSQTTYAKGDRIRFSKGELLNLGGTVTGVREDGKIMVHPDIVGFDEDVDCDPDELTKSFFVGDKVMVMSGTHAGETGMLLKLETSGQCSILSDTTKEEITLMLRDLTQNPETDTGVEVLGSYNLHDLVQLDNNTAGVIFKIEREAARVLTSNGTLERPEIRVCREPDMLRKVFSKNTTTTDKNSQRVKVGDFVSIVDGPAAFKGKGGAVEHIFRNSLFIKGRDFSFDHAGGFICVRSRSCVVRGGALSASDVLRASGNPALMGGSGYVPQSPMHPAAGETPSTLLDLLLNLPALMSHSHPLIL